MTTIQSDVTALETYNTSNDSVITAIQAEIADLQDDRATNSSLTALQGTVDGHKTSITSIQTDISALQSYDYTNDTNMTNIQSNKSDLPNLFI